MYSNTCYPIKERYSLKAWIIYSQRHLLALCVAQNHLLALYMAQHSQLAICVAQQSHLTLCMAQYSQLAICVAQRSQLTLYMDQHSQLAICVAQRSQITLWMAQHSASHMYGSTVPPNPLYGPTLYIPVRITYNSTRRKRLCTTLCSTSKKYLLSVPLSSIYRQQVPFILCQVNAVCQEKDCSHKEVYHLKWCRPWWHLHTWTAYSWWLLPWTW